MSMDSIDPTGVIGESFLIEGIGAPECRSILLDWALSLRDPMTPAEAIPLLLARHVARAGHPMTATLQAGLAAADAPRRRGGRAGRVTDPG